MISEMDAYTDSLLLWKNLIALVANMYEKPIFPFCCCHELLEGHIMSVDISHSCIEMCSLVGRVDQRFRRRSTVEGCKVVLSGRAKKGHR